MGRYFNVHVTSKRLIFLDKMQWRKVIPCCENHFSGKVTLFTERNVLDYNEFSISIFQILHLSNKFVEYPDFLCVIYTDNYEW